MCTCMYYYLFKSSIPWVFPLLASFSLLVRLRLDFTTWDGSQQLLSWVNYYHSFSTIFKRETTFFILQNMFRHSFVIFNCKCLIVVHLNFHCIHEYDIEVRHKIYVDNLDIAIHLEKRLCKREQYGSWNRIKI